MTAELRYRIVGAEESYTLDELLEQSHGEREPERIGDLLWPDQVARLRQMRAGDSGSFDLGRGRACDPGQSPAHVVHVACEAGEDEGVRDAYREAGAVTAEEALEILSRFVASHFRKTDRERARFSIPANPRRDDDIRMGAFIRASSARVRELEGLAAQYLDQRDEALVQRDDRQACSDLLARLTLAVGYLLDRAQKDAKLGYHLGPHVEAWERLVALEAEVLERDPVAHRSARAKAL